MYKARVHVITPLILVALGFSLLPVQDMFSKSGTIIIVHYTDDMISVAADSRQTPKYAYTYYGSDDAKLIKEFMERKTPRAIKAMDEMMNSVIPENTPRADLEAMILNTAMQYALDSPKHSDEVGGDIDILELPKIGNSSWKKIKPECEDARRVDAH
jgi:hypothetical protein